jgi:hypothetical protein
MEKLILARWELYSPFRIGWEEWDTCLILIVKGGKGRDIVVWDIILEKKILGFKIWE